MKMVDSKIIIVSALITALVGCGSDSGTTTTTTVTENIKSANECFSQYLYQAGEYDVVYNYKDSTISGFTQEHIKISLLEDKDGINQI